jgi:hypothetical protein
MERENFTHICVVQVFCSFNLYIVYSTVSTLYYLTIILPFASNRDRQTLKRVCLRLKRHVGRVKHANYNVETKRFDRDM